MASGLTQRELAGGNLSASYVSLLEAGKRQPTMETIRMLADALSCDVGELTEPAAPEEPLALLLAQANLALAAGQAVGALEGYERVLAAGPEDMALSRRARIGLGKALQRMGRLTEAAVVFERCARLGAADPANEASLEAYLGWCRCLFELGELVRAADVGRAALAEFDAAQARESELSIQLIATVAGIWVELGDLREAEHMLDEGLERATAVQSPTARGAILWNASMLAHERGRYQEAIELSEEALRAFQGTDARRNVGRLLCARGYLLLRCDPPRTGEAFDSLTQALGEFDAAGDPVDRAYVFTELCYAHLARAEVRQAIEVAETARNLLGPTAQMEFARAGTALAVARTAAGDHETARKLFTEAATVLGRLGASRHAARTWVELARALTDAGMLSDAVTAYERAARAMNISGPRQQRNR